MRISPSREAPMEYGSLFLPCHCLSAAVSQPAVPDAGRSREFLFSTSHPREDQRPWPHLAEMLTEYCSLQYLFDFRSRLRSLAFSLAFLSPIKFISHTVKQPVLHPFVNSEKFILLFSFSQYSSSLHYGQAYVNPVGTAAGC